MVKYNRVSTRNDDSQLEAPEPDELMGESLATGPPSSSATKTVTRKGSHASSGSLASLNSVDQESRHRKTNDDGSNDVNEDIDEHHDGDEFTHLSGERSPLRRSFDSDDLDVSVPSLHGDPPAGTTTGSKGNSPTQSLSPKPVYASISALYSGSFDFDDDDDDEEIEAELRRYHLDFSSSQRGSTLTYSLHGASSTNGNPPGSASRLSFSKYVWYSIQSVRQQARHRRAQLLLQQTERNCQQSLWICIMTYCDATDQGIMLVTILIVAWSLLVWRIQDPFFRRWIIGGGAAVFAVRVGTRPLCDYCRRERHKRQLRRMQQLPQHSPTSKQALARRHPAEPSSLSDSRERVNPPYDDRRQVYHPYGNNDGGLELQSMDDTAGGWNNGTQSRDPAASDVSPPEIQHSRSNGSDPTIAAI